MALQVGKLNTIPIFEDSTNTGIPKLGSVGTNKDMVFSLAGFSAIRQSPHIVNSISDLTGITGSYLISNHSYQTLYNTTADDGSGNLYKYYTTGRSSITVDNYNYVSGTLSDDFFGNVSRMVGTDDQDASEVSYTGDTPDNYTPTDPHVEGHLEGIDAALTGGSIIEYMDIAATNSSGVLPQASAQHVSLLSTQNTVTWTDYSKTVSSILDLNYRISSGINDSNDITFDDTAPHYSFSVNGSGIYDITAVITFNINRRVGGATNEKYLFRLLQVIDGTTGLVAGDSSTIYGDGYELDRYVTNNVMSWQGYAKPTDLFMVLGNGGELGGDIPVLNWNVTVNKIT